MSTGPARVLITGAAGLLAVLSTIGATHAGEIAPHYHLWVDGMNAPLGAYGLERTLSRLEGVQHIRIDMDRGLVTVVVSEGVRLDPDALRRLVGDAGFSLRSFQRVSFPQ